MESLKGATTERIGSSIATTLEGAVKFQIIKELFSNIIRLMPYIPFMNRFNEKVQGAALRFHLKKALDSALSVGELKIELKAPAFQARFNNATREKIGEFMQALERAEGNIAIASKKAKAQLQQAKANTESSIAKADMEALQETPTLKAEAEEVSLQAKPQADEAQGLTRASDTETSLKAKETDELATPSKAEETPALAKEEKTETLQTKPKETESTQALKADALPQEIKDAIDLSPQKGRNIATIGRENVTPQVIKYIQNNNKKIAIETLSEEEAKKLGFKYPHNAKATIDYSAIKHILKRHGKNSKLAKSGAQKAVSHKDIARYRDIIKNADEVLESVDRGGRRAIVSFTQVNGNYIVVEQVSSKRSELSLKTMFKEKGNYKESKSYKDTKAQTLSIGSEPRANSFASANKNANTKNTTTQFKNIRELVDFYRKENRDLINDLINNPVSKEEALQRIEAQVAKGKKDYRDFIESIGREVDGYPISFFPNKNEVSYLREEAATIIIPRKKTSYEIQRERKAEIARERAQKELDVFKAMVEGEKKLNFLDNFTPKTAREKALKKRYLKALEGTAHAELYTNKARHNLPKMQEIRRALLNPAKDRNVLALDIISLYKKHNSILDKNIKDFIFTHSYQSRMDGMYYADKINLINLRGGIENSQRITPSAQYGTNYAEFYRDGKGAIAKILAEAEDYSKRKASGKLSAEEAEQGAYKGQVAGAMHREELGDIDLIYSDGNNGLSRIIKEHANNKKLGDNIKAVLENGKLEIRGDSAIINKRIDGIDAEARLTKHTDTNNGDRWILSDYKESKGKGGKASDTHGKAKAEAEAETPALAKETENAQALKAHNGDVVAKANTEPSTPLKVNETSVQAQTEPTPITPKTTREIIDMAKAQGLSVKETRRLVNENKKNIREAKKARRGANKAAKNSAEEAEGLRTKAQDESEMPTRASDESVMPKADAEELDLSTAKISEIKSAFLKDLKPLFNKPLKNIENREGYLNIKSLNKMLSDKAIQKSVNNGFTREEHLSAVKNIKSLFEKAHKAFTKTDELDKNLLIHRYNAPFKDANALLTLKEYLSNGKKIYSLELENLEAIKFNPSGKDLMEHSPISKDASTAKSSTPIDEPKDIVAEKKNQPSKLRQILENIQPLVKFKRQIEELNNMSFAHFLQNVAK